MRTLITILFLCLVIPGQGQTKTQFPNTTLKPGLATTAGMSEERLDRIKNMLDQAVQQNEIPGGVVLIARNGQIVMHEAFGTSNAPGKKTFKKDDIFRIASQTKAITATAVMTLWEEGKIRLDDPIEKYIPEFKDPQVLESFNEADSSYTTIPADKSITIRHLLSHTSGIGYGMIDGDERFRKIYQKAGIIDAFTTENTSLKENISKLAALPLHHNPGENWTYSEGLDVLGYMIEIVSGKPFDRYLKEHIFDPLGMNDTWFYLPSDKADRLVPVQVWKENTWQLFDTSVFNVNYPIEGAKSYFAGGAGLSSTAKDYAVFLQMILNGGVYGNVRILSRTTVATLLENQIGEIWNGAKDFSLAFAVVNDDGTREGGIGTPGTFDWGGYFNTQYFADPQEQLIGILLKQSDGASSDSTGWKFRQMVFAAIDD